MTVLVVAYVLLLAVALGALTARRVPWPVKLALIVTVPWFAFAIFSTADSLRGWPTGDAPPKAATFVWGVVAEPDPQTGSAGEIDLWLSTGGTPRAYRLPYSRQLHKQVDQASRLARRGVPVAVVRRPQTRAGTRGRRQGGAFQFYRLPPPSPPRKR